METNDLLACALQIIGRIAIPAATVREVIGQAKKKQLKAYNLCDGTRTVGQIAKKVKIDSGNFSRTAQRWIEHGIVFSFADGIEKRLLHIYPLPEDE